MRIRPTVRMLVINERNEILLIQHEGALGGDERQPKWMLTWVSPGGGLEANETHKEAAIRELREETGIKDVAIGPWIWMYERLVVVNGESVLRQGRYYLVRVGDPAVSFAHIEEAERPVFQEIRWWTLAELRETLDVLVPVGLPELVAPILQGRLPAPPLTLRL